MPALVVTLPIVPGKTEAWRRFCQETLGARRSAYEASRRRLGVHRELFWLAQTPTGEAAMVYLEADDPGRTISRLAASDRPFDRWFKEKMRELHGVELAHSISPHGPELIFEWNAA